MKPVLWASLGLVLIAVAAFVATREDEPPPVAQQVQPPDFEPQLIQAAALVRIGEYERAAREYERIGPAVARAAMMAEACRLMAELRDPNGAADMDLSQRMESLDWSLATSDEAPLARKLRAALDERRVRLATQRSFDALEAHYRGTAVPENPDRARHVQLVLATGSEDWRRRVRDVQEPAFQAARERLDHLIQERRTAQAYELRERIIAEFPWEDWIAALPAIEIDEPDPEPDPAPKPEPMNLGFTAADSEVVPERDELWLLDGHQNRIVALDLKSSRVASTVDLDFEPDWIARGGTTACVVGGKAATAVVVDFEFASISTQAPLPAPNPIGVAAVPATNPDRLYVLYRDRIVELDPKSLATIRTIQRPAADGIGDMLITPDGTRFVVAGSGGLSVYTLESPPRLLTHLEGEWPRPPFLRIDSWGQYLIVNRGALQEYTIVTLQTGRPIATLALNAIHAHPDLPYLVSLQRGRWGFFSLYDEQVEIEDVPVEGAVSEVYPSEIHLLPDSGRAYVVPLHVHHPGNPCGQSGPVASQVAALTLPVDRLKYKTPALAFRSHPESSAPVGRLYEYRPVVDGAKLTLETVPEATTWDAAGRVFRWKPTVAEIERRIELTFVAEAGDASIRQRAAVTAGVAVVPGSAHKGLPRRFRLSMDGRWLYAPEPSEDDAFRIVIVDLVEARTFRTRFEVRPFKKGTSVGIPPTSLGDLDGVLLMAAGGEQIDRLDLETMEMLDPLPVGFSNPYGLGPGGEDSILLMFNDPRADASVYRMTSRGELTAIEGIRKPANDDFRLQLNRDGTMMLVASNDAAAAYGIDGGKRTLVTAVKDIPSFPSRPGDIAGFSHDGRSMLIGTKLLKLDGKTVTAERGPGFMALDPTADRYVHFSNGFLRVYAVGSETPLAVVKLEQIVIPSVSFRDGIPPPFFLSGAPNALILETSEGVALIHLP